MNRELERGQGKDHRQEAHSQMEPQVCDFSVERASVFTCCLFFLLPTLFRTDSVLLFPNSPSTLQETFY